MLRLRRSRHSSAAAGEAWAGCVRFGLDDAGRAYIGSTLAPGMYVSDSVEALRALISAVKAGEADHLL